MPARYSVCGLGLQVNVAVDSLKGLSAEGEVDVRAVLGSLPPGLDPARSDFIEYFVDTDLDELGRPCVKAARRGDGRYYRLAYSAGITVVVDACGSEVWATWSDGMTVEDAASFLTGSVLGFVLRLRGVTCLHGSAIALGERAIAIVGPSGSGKSSTAAGFARRGNAVLTDDIAALRETGKAFYVEPAFPRVHLWPTSARAMFEGWESLPRITSSWDKRRLDLDGPGFRFQSAPLPLAAIYLLDERESGDFPRIEPMSAANALIALLADSHAADFIDRPQRATEFDALARLLDRVPVRRVTPCEDLERVPQLCVAIARDFDRMGATPSTPH